VAPEEASGGRGAVPSKLDPESQQWAIQRRIEDVFAKLGEKFGDLTGRVEVRLHPDTTFEQIGGLREAKSIVRSLGTALTDPELYRKWGITPPKGVLLFGPPGTGKSLLARALATETGAVFYHLKLMNLTSKFGPTTGELLPDGAAQQEVLELTRRRTEANAGRPLFADIDYRSILPPMGGMSGAEISEIARRALEQKVHAAGQGQDSGLVTTQDILHQIDAYRRIREMVEKIRYGQYL